MKLYKQTLKDGRETPRYYLDFFDHEKNRRRIAVEKSKKCSEEFARNVDLLIQHRRQRRELDTALNQWLETLPGDILKKFIAWDMIDSRRTEATKPLKTHIADYVKSLESKELSRHYVVQIEGILLKTIADCRLLYFRDITQSAIEIYLGKLKADSKSNTTAGHYLAALKGFLNWAYRDRRILSNPIAAMQKPTRNSKRKGVLTPEQFIELIKTTYAKNIIIQDRRRGTTTGQQRAALYLVSGCTGLRKKELLNLLWGDIRLEEENPYILLRTTLTKNKKEDRQPLPPIAAGVLSSIRADIKPEPADRVFAAISRWINTAGLIKTDLEAAQIPLKDREGNKILFHSLRNSYISFLANSQTPPKVVQQLARHSDPKLTFNVYARSFADAEQKAIANLPDFGDFHYDSEYDIKHTLGGILVEQGRVEKRDIAINTAFSSSYECARQDSNLQP